jgi:hypothetical protein
VPSEIAAFQSQQHRWAKGSVQVARKLGGRIARAGVAPRIKLEAAAHLLGNCGYPFVTLLALLLPLVAVDSVRLAPAWNLAAFCVCTLSVALFYARAQRAIGRPARRLVLDVLAAMALGVGMCLSQTRAVLAGAATRRGGEFVRTPKRGDAPSSARYRHSWRRAPWLELAFAAWFAVGLVRVVRAELWASVPFLALFFTGFAWVGLAGLRARLRRARPARQDGVASVRRLAGEGLSG